MSFQANQANESNLLCDGLRISSRSLASPHDGGTHVCGSSSSVKVRLGMTFRYFFG